ncbi:MAG: hypothetical protein A2268_03425 [Candidatus Raymondbacteria bacterium RifOxyA12_full_50_37]|uniref:EF-hand domain-containing protein n=1 Tax=Candidatus Raymondbacteria bacterium RIFOXYD12_FULL_49_13 TaxID=1817890 RepID=A0A1F7F3P8_UNCRA|nr:MAG: hypothetical protein A2268_03425 [Candidatus Raymondbacteria bacterium RifOxyA12_full_50_37]OGJ88398.1 MAG: hypothetical protein A2248_00985 [Candidatus Raymondbacteria bacterium RIFOXYA2_FULL_49_16]OGJ96236.1 MAG: hypothetical protein A2453_08715 [Candidatus Raymondbacteria bacterium RIFOXYC2_FULL_50_21]OGK00573.1 MAG: hypothetical protein A2350_21640 [Candidatus Raymondbacteria bacterium RifOxyB12_full_50_8]OGK01228.1 MAG: hypothetical protein A2519_22530 [Candidatus Raymondbacteria b
MLPRILSNRKGFTVIELVAALAVTSAVMLILFSVYAFTDRMYQKSVGYSGLNQIAAGLAAAVESNLFECKGIVSASPAEIVFQKKNKNTGAYTIDEGRLLYNGTLLGQKAAQISSVSFAYSGKPEDPAMGEDYAAVFNALDKNQDGVIAESELSGLRLISVAMTIKSGKDSVEVAFNVHIRGKAVL